MIAHQRLAHCAGYNLADVTRKNVYFRVERADFAEYVDQYVVARFPWMGFEGLSEVLPKGLTEIPERPEKQEDGNGNGVNGSVTPAQRVLAARPMGQKLPGEQQQKLTITDDMKSAFVRDGFIVLRNIIAKGLLEKAMRKVQMALENGKFSENDHHNYEGTSKPLVKFNKHVLTSCMITDVLFRSGLIDVAEQFLGKQSVVLLDSAADLMYIPSNKNENGRKGDKLREQDVRSTDGPRPGGWEVSMGSGRYRAKGMDHMLRISVALTDGMNAEEDRGQVVVWPGMQNLSYSEFHIFLAFSIYLFLLLRNSSLTC